MTANPASCPDRPELQADVTVIGAGIVGAATAYALACRGLAVHLVERDAPARGTSGACEGNLVLWDRPTAPDLELARRSHARWAELAGELLEETGLDIEFERKGSLMLVDSESAADAETKCAWLAEHDVVFEWLDAAAAHEAEPALAFDVERAVFFPRDAQLEPRIATAALVAAAQARRAVLHLHEPVMAISVDGHGTTVTTARHRIQTKFAVIAAGVWTPGLVAHLAPIPVSARKGQVAVVSAPWVHVRHKVMEAGYARTVSNDERDLQVAAVVEGTRSGTILLGSSRLATGPDDRAVDIAVLSRIIARAVRFFPQLAPAQLVRGYAGLRPMSADHVPIIGPLPDHPSVVLATGHEGGGVMMAAATGELVADLIAGDKAVAHVPYLPDRFSMSNEQSR